MRIAHIATRYLRGGSEARIRDTVSAIPEADHRLIVGEAFDAGLVSAQLPQVKLTVIPSLVRDPDPSRDPLALAQLARLLRSGGCDLIVTHQSKAGAVGRMAARLAGIPTVHSLSMASFGPGYPTWQDRLFRGIETRLAPATAAYAVVGSDLAERYRRIGVPATKLHVVRSGARLPSEMPDRWEVARVRRRVGVPTGRPFVLSLGSLDARKGVEHLPEVLESLLALTDDHRPYLVIAGDGALRSSIEGAFGTRRMSADVTFLGHVDHPLPLVASASCLLSLSSAEGLPQVLIQAAASGTPFVAFEVDGVREVLALGGHGEAVPLGDIQGAAAAVSRMLQVGRRDPHVDLSSWTPAAIAEGHRRVIELALVTPGELAA